MLLVLLLIALGFGAWKSYALDHSIEQREVDIAKAIKPYVDAERLQRTRADKVSGQYEELKGQDRVRTEVINHKVEKITERPVYRNVCLDVDGVSALNEAGRMEPASESDTGLSRPP
ncbi:hypothetical protein [Acinetobacter sp. SFA]|uniref:hypothetical protein n=1 Tax=Acinetobacter sp. SFA TaxID=1805633 RepID=UPI001D0CF000|nr:hypothetical protein [Acinetobacter sp. SFA]